MAYSDPNGVSAESYSKLASHDIPFLVTMTSNNLFDVKGDLSVGKTVYFGENMTFGDATTDKLTVTGELNIAGPFIQDQTVLVVDTDVDGTVYNFIDLDGTSANVVLTNLQSNVGQHLVITCSDSSNTTTVTTKSGTTFDGTNNTATFDAADETLILFGITATAFVIVENIGSVGMSSV